MTRGSVLAIGVAGLISVFGSSSAFGGVDQFFVNGDPNIVIFDANGNNKIGDPGDCIVHAFAYDSTLNFHLTQTESYSPTIPLRICEPCDSNNAHTANDVVNSSAIVTATGTVGPGMGQTTFTDACPSSSFGDIPVTANFASGPSVTPSPTSMVTTGSGAGNGQYGDPFLDPLGAAEIREADFPFQPLGSGFLCNAGGRAAAQIRDEGGVSLLVDVLGNGYGYACVPIPLQRADTFEIVFIKACFPLNDSNQSRLTLDGTAIAALDLDELPPCTLEDAPTANELTLMLSALGLIGIGAWLLGRRKGFAQLPQP